MNKFLFFIPTDTIYEILDERKTGKGETVYLILHDNNKLYVSSFHFRNLTEEELQNYLRINLKN